MIKVSFQYYLSCILFSIVVFLFFSLRTFEILTSCLNNPLHLLLVISSLLGILSLFLRPTITNGLFARRVGLIALVLYQLKSEIDEGLVNNVPRYDLSQSIVIVTGANSGTGYAISEKLALLNATVIMGCRSEKKCNDSSQTILTKVSQIKSCVGTVIPMSLDLSDLSSIKSFVQIIKKKYQRIDILVNNAGLVPGKGERTKQGIEMAFGVMHIGHFALTKWLLDYLQKPLPKQLLSLPSFPISSRVVYVGSQAYLNGKLPDSMLFGNGSGDLQGEITDNCPFEAYGFLPCCPRFACPYTNGYSRAKLANIFTTFELQRRSDISGKNKRRIVTSVLHPGVVTTNISWFLSESSPISFFLRTSEQASEIILYAILSNDYVPSSYIDGMKYSHDLLGFKNKYLSNHLVTFPYSSNYTFSKLSFDIVSYDQWNWNRTEFLYSINGKLNETLKEISPDTLAARLYDLSDQMINDYDKKKPIFSSNLQTSKMY